MEQAVQERKIGPFEKRIHEIDFLRGVLMCLVIMDHIFNLLMSYNGTWAGEAGLQPFKAFHDFFYFYWHWPVRVWVRYLALGGFCFLSGISSAFSRNNWRRAIEMIILWAIIFIGSNLLQWGYSASGWNLGIRTCRVDFNIIGVLAFSTLIYYFFQNKSWKVLAIVAAIGIAHTLALQVFKILFISRLHLMHQVNHLAHKLQMRNIVLVFVLDTAVDIDSQHALGTGGHTTRTQGIAKAIVLNLITQAAAAAQ